MQLRKLAASALGALMTGATLAFPAAAASLADYPQPFVSDSEANFSVVVGSNAKVADVASAIDVAVTLGGQPTTQKTVQTGGATEFSMKGGKLLEKVGNKLVYGEAINNATSRLDGDDIAAFEETTFQNEDGDELTAEGEMTIYGNADVQFSTTADDLDVPVMNINTSAGPIYQLNWDPEAFTPNKVSGESVQMFGNSYTFADQKSKLSTDNITIYGSSVVKTIDTGESVTIGEDTISVTGANTKAMNPTVTIEVNNDMESATEGESITIGGVDLYVKDIFINTVGETTASAKVSVGSNEILLDNNNKVSIGGDSVDGTNVSIGTSGSQISDISINVTPTDLDSDNNPQGYDEFNYIEEGDKFVDPVFGATELNFAGRNIPLGSDQRSTVKLENNGDDLKVTFTSEGGDEYSMNMIEADKSHLGVAGDGLVTSRNSGLVGEDDYFVVTAGSGTPYYTHVLQFDEYDSDDKVCVVNDAATGEDVAEYDNGACVLDLESDVTISDVQNDSGGFTYSDLPSAAKTNSLYTDNGLSITLDSWQNITIKEEYSDELNLADETTPATMAVNVSYDSTDGALINNLVNVPTKSIEDESDQGGTAYGTGIEYDDEDNEYITFSVPETEVQYKVLVGPAGSEVSKSAGGAVTYNKIVPITSSVSQLDTAVTETEKTNAENNMILVGGPCVNMLTQELLNNGKLEGVNANETQCFNQWTKDTPEVQMVENAFVDGQTALVVAGMTKEDTANAAAALQDIGNLPDAATKNV